MAQMLLLKKQVSVGVVGSTGVNGSVVANGSVGREV